MFYCPRAHEHYRGSLLEALPKLNVSPGSIIGITMISSSHAMPFFFFPGLGVKGGCSMGGWGCGAGRGREVQSKSVLSLTKCRRFLLVDLPAGFCKRSFVMLPDKNICRWTSPR